MNDWQTRDLRDVMRGPPTGYFVVVPRPEVDEQGELSALVSKVLVSWKLLALMTFLGALAAFGVSLELRKTFRAQALIAPVAPSGVTGASGLRSEFGGLAALAGVDLGSSNSRKEEWLATLTSNGLATDFIQSKNLLPILYSERWDPATKGWRAGTSPPTMEDAVKRLTTNVRTITEDRRTGLVTVAVEWYSPDLAATWANDMIEMANERLRTEAIDNAERSIQYLNKELAKTTVVGLQQSIYRLIEEQVSHAMLANVQREYAFRFIDRAVPPQTRASPRRLLFAAVGAFAGLTTAVLVVVVNAGRRARHPEKSSSG
jgi:uncharacterized protein involved in exopolysaccharide biosynthesis